MCCTLLNLCGSSLLRHQLVASETLPIHNVIHDDQLRNPVPQLLRLLYVQYDELCMAMCAHWVLKLGSALTVADFVCNFCCQPSS